MARCGSTRTMHRRAPGLLQCADSKSQLARRASALGHYEHERPVWLFRADVQDRAQLWATN
eukprot:1571499-Rhodomonas_salina.1